MHELLKGLHATRDLTLSYFDLDESDMERRYSPGKWTIKQLLHHITDAETVLYDRIRRGISKPDQVVWGFDQDAWAVGLDYNTLPVKEAKETYKAVRNSIITLAQKYYVTHGKNQYIHSETGLRTVKDEFDKIVWHNKHHLDQMDIAMGTC